MTPAERSQLRQVAKTVESLSELNDIIPAVKNLVKEKQEQEIFNRKAAQIGRYIMVVAGAIGTVLGTMWAVSKLVFTLGSNG